MQSNSYTAANLNYLRASPSELLDLACTLYLAAKPRSFLSYMEEGFAIFEVWCKQHPGWAKSSSLVTYPEDWGAVCICGNQGISGEGLRYHCEHCKADARKQKITQYEINRIASYLNLPYFRIEYSMIHAIGYNYARYYRT